MTLSIIWRFTQMCWRDCHAWGTFLAAELRGIFTNGDFNLTCSQSSRHSPANPASYANSHQKMEGIHWAIFLVYSCINQTAVSSSDSLWTLSPFPWVHSRQNSYAAGPLPRNEVAIVYWGNIPRTYRQNVAPIVNLVNADDDGPCMSDMNIRMRKLLTRTNEKMSWSSGCSLLNYEFMKIIGDQ